MAVSIMAIFSRFSLPLIAAGNIMVFTATKVPFQYPAITRHNTAQLRTYSWRLCTTEGGVHQRSPCHHQSSNQQGHTVIPMPIICYFLCVRFFTSCCNGVTAMIDKLTHRMNDRQRCKRRLSSPLWDHAATALLANSLSTLTLEHFAKRAFAEDSFQDQGITASEIPGDRSQPLPGRLKQLLLVLTCHQASCTFKSSYALLGTRHMDICCCTSRLLSPVR